MFEGKETETEMMTDTEIATAVETMAETVIVSAVLVEIPRSTATNRLWTRSRGTCKVSTRFGVWG